MLLLLLSLFSYLPKALLNAHNFALDGFLAASFRHSCKAQRSTTDTERNNRQKELPSDSETQIKINKFIAKDSRNTVNPQRNSKAGPGSSAL